MRERISPLVQAGLFAVLGTILVTSLAPRLGPDFWWHVRTGRLIVESGGIPKTDVFSFTRAGQPWINHEWLAEVGMYGATRVGGVWGAIAAAAILVTAAFALVFARMRVRGTPPLAGVVALAIAFYASSLSWGPRVQMVTLFFAAAFAYALERRTRAWLVVMPMLMLLWSNLHGGFVVGLAMMLIVVIGEKLPRDLMLSLGASIVAAAINPNGVAQFLYPLKFLTPNAFTRLIMESASPDFHRPAMLAFEVLLLAGVAAAMLARKQMRATDVLMLIAFTHLALSQSRNVALWSVVVTPIVADLAGAFLPQREAADERRLVPAILAMAVAAILISSAMRAFYADAPAAAEAESFPVQATQFAATHKLPPNLYTSYEWGGYAIDKLWPRYRVFIDSRADTVYDARVLDDYWTAFNGSPEWRAIFARRGVTTALVPRRSFIAEELRAARAEWMLVELDDQAALFVRITSR